MVTDFIGGIIGSGMREAQVATASLEHESGFHFETGPRQDRIRCGTAS
jgi:hypothetical protein